jgi:biopolymer transport protein ExbD
MKFRRARGSGEERIRLHMTPMIDVVFLLLVFFIFTFKIVAQEGDFNIKMPLAAPRDALPDDHQLPPMKVRLEAGIQGELAGLSLNNNSFEDFEQLHNYIIAIIGPERGPGSAQETAQVELDCDYNLRYEYVVRAITAVSGHLDETGRVVELVEKIKLAAPRPPGN